MQKKHLTKSISYSTIQSFSELGIENFLNVIKSPTKKSTDIFNVQRRNTFAVRSRNRTKMSVLISSIQHCTGDPTQYSTARGKKAYCLENRDVKESLLANNMVCL